MLARPATLAVAHLAASPAPGGSSSASAPRSRASAATRGQSVTTSAPATCGQPAHADSAFRSSRRARAARSSGASAGLSRVFAREKPFAGISAQALTA